MLVRLTDKSGTDWWVNPMHVKAVKGKRGLSEVFLALNSTWGQTSIKVRQSPDEVATLLNAAMPEVFAYAPPDDEGGAAAAGGGAAAAAATG